MARRAVRNGDNAAMQIEGVVTTGIYCRSDCAASPFPEHTRPFPTAAAAEAAGFRPCLRCRPWRLPAPQVGGAPAAVERALMLITEGFLDEGGEPDLARHVGLSGRQLRRDFEEAIGASPDAVARSRRAHFARRLLDETAMSVSDVAFAAGFGSIRQFNRVMRAVFRAAPGELRAKRRRSDLLATDGGLRLRVAYRPPLAVREAIDYLGPRAIPGVEIASGGVYRRTMHSCGHPGVIEVFDHGDGAHLEIVAHLPSFAALIDEVARVRRLFRTDVDMRPAVAALSGDPLLGALVTAAPGLRVLGAWDRFETGVRVVLGQQVSVAAATTLAGRLVQRYGAPLVGLSLPSGLTHLFPAAERLAEASDLADIGLPKARAASLREFARRFADGVLHLEGTPDLEKLTGTLMEIPGIGPWSAQLLAARMYDHPDAFPANDLGLRRAAARLLGRDDFIPATALVELAEQWRPFRSVAAAYLWRSGASSAIGGSSP